MALLVSFDPMLEELLAAAAFVVNCSIKTIAPMGFAEPPLVAASPSP